MIISNLNYNIHNFQRQMFLIQNTYHIIEQTPVHTHRRHHLIQNYIHFRKLYQLFISFFLKLLLLLLSFPEVQLYLSARCHQRIPG